MNVQELGLVYLTKQEAADIARVSVRTIERWIANEWLRAGGGPGSVRIRLDWLTACLEQQNARCS